jgi:hypothetical protein
MRCAARLCFWRRFFGQRRAGGHEINAVDVHDEADHIAGDALRFTFPAMPYALARIDAETIIALTAAWARSDPIFAAAFQLNATARDLLLDRHRAGAFNPGIEIERVHEVAVASSITPSSCRLVTVMKPRLDGQRARRQMPQWRAFVVQLLGAFESASWRSSQWRAKNPHRALSRALASRRVGVWTLRSPDRWETAAKGLLNDLSECT